MDIFSRICVCPDCHASLVSEAQGLRCSLCNSFFKINEYGFLEFTANKDIHELNSTTEEYARTQESSGRRIYQDYLKPFFHQRPFRRVLDVGCGIGKPVSLLKEEGYQAYGVDLPNLSRFWANSHNDPGHFFCCDSLRLPFKNDFFDIVYSIGVVEHIGTRIGHCELSDNYHVIRQAYANEILRVTKPGGRILIACPNKSFLIDAQHGPTDASGPKRKLRSYIFQKTRLNIHPVWGKYHLPSYSEIKDYFVTRGGASNLESLSLQGYFGFSKSERGFVRLFTEYEYGILRLFTEAGKAYINHLPKFLRPTFLNPYILVQIIK